ncbi:UNVERIFIED_CONTAM: Aldehyde dehydrogenase family 2 member C4 [Sesamum indicum]
MESSPTPFSISGKTFETIRPRTEQVIANIAEGDKEDVDLAVNAARHAFDHGPWPRLPASQRTRIMLKFADLMDENAHELAALNTIDVYTLGKNILIPAAAEIVRYYAGAANKIHGMTLKMSREMQGYTLVEPIGPAEQTPLSALYYAHLAKQAGVPDGVINVVTGYGSTAGAAIASHNDIDMVTFTGSTETGRHIMQAAAMSNLKAVSLELGGKSPFIVFSDADVDQAATLALQGCFYNQPTYIIALIGQICVAASRVFVQAEIYDKFIMELVEKVKARVVGDPFDPKSMGRGKPLLH